MNAPKNTFTRLATFFVILMLVLVALPVQQAQARPSLPAAAITLVNANIGSNATRASAGTSLSITTAAAVAAGDDIVLSFAMDGNNGTISASDTAGNSYVIVADVTNNNNVRTVILVAYHAKALASGSTITITHPSSTPRAAVASVFRGLAVNGLDKTSTNTGNSNNPSSGNTATTTQADELLIGGIGTEGPSSDTAGTWQNSFTDGARVGTGGGGSNPHATISMGYRIVGATGAYAAAKTGITSRQWAAAIATFKRDNTPPTVTINQASGQSDPTSAAPINFTVVFSEQVVGFTGADVDLSASTAGGTLSATVTEIAPNNGTTFNVAVSGMSSSGTVVASIPAGVVTDVAGNSNTASSSTDNTVTYNHVIATTLTVAPASGDYNGTVDLSATLTQTSGGMPISGKTISFTLNGSPVGSAVTDGSGVASLTGISLSGINAGTYPTGIGATFATDGTYGSSSDSATLTVNPLPLTITADAQSKVYGDPDPTLTYQITSGSLLPGDSLTGSLSRVTGETVGTYAISQGSLSAGPNYAITFVGANLTITPRPITITADAKSKVYGDSDPTLTYQITSGSLAFTDTLTGSLSRVAGENVGTYAITQGTLTAGPNYTLTFVGANLTITPRPITVTADAKSKVYGDSDPTLTYQITSGSLRLGDSLSGALSRTAGENIGTYAIQQGSLSGGTNYTITFVGANFTITQRPITVTADNKTKVYGDPDPILTYQITSGSLAFDDVLSGSLQRDPGHWVGNFSINQGTLTASPNYDLTFISGLLTITPRPVTVAADPKSKTYGDLDPVLTYQVILGTVMPGDSFSGALERDPGEDAGAYAIKQGTLSLSSNYDMSFVSANLTINLRPITVKADPKTKFYGDPDPALTYTVTSGSLAPGDSFTGGLIRQPGQTVGTYSIQQGTLSITNISNYNMVYLGDTFTINQRPLTLSADNKNKTYGDADPALTYTITAGSVAPGDSITGSLTRAVGENAGTYPINQGTLTVSNLSNYAFTFNGATFTIHKANLTVTADDKHKVVGEPDPVFTFTYSGFVSGDTESDIDTPPVCGVSGDHSLAGTYPIVCSGGVDNNYDFTYVSGTLTVTAVNNPPTDISLSNSSVDENQPVGTLVGSLSATDPDPGDTHTFSFCGGPDDASFQLSGNNLLTNAIFDYETKASYDICLRTDDGHGGTFDKAFTITVNNLPEALTATFRSTASQDGWILESSETSGTGGSLNATATTFNLGDDAQDRQYRTILSFNTAALPDNATIVSITLKIKRQGIVGTNPFLTHGKILVDIRKGIFGTVLLQLSDFKATASKNGVGQFVNAPLSGNWYSVNLNAASFPFLNKTGITQFRLRFAKDDNDDLSADFLKFFSGNAALAYRPVLIIQYTVP